MWLADFHVHTNFSDGRMPLRDVVDLYGQYGFGAIAITDHLCESETLLGQASAYLNYTLTPQNFANYMELLQQEAERAWDQYKMVVIPGVELTKNTLSNHRSAHILALGISEYIQADADPSVLIDQIHEQGALAIAAHPVWTRKFEKQTYHLWSRKEELAEKFDAWEVASGPYIFEEVARTSLPKIASSDLHHPRQIASWNTVLTCEKHPEAILEAIKKQRMNFQFWEPPVTAHTNFVKAPQQLLLSA